MRTVLDRQHDAPVTLLFGCRSEDDVIYRRELESLRLRLPQLRLIVTLSRPGPNWTGEIGRVDPSLLAQHIAEPAAARYFLCGPGEMRASLTEWLKGQAVPADRIHFEMFGKAAAPRKESALA